MVDDEHQWISFELITNAHGYLGMLVKCLNRGTQSLTTL